MKRMSEVFNLPISGDKLEKVMLEADFCTEQDCAAHAINHVDVLADALEVLIAASENHAANFKSEYFDAVDTLAAYRGEK